MAGIAHPHTAGRNTGSGLVYDFYPTTPIFADTLTACPGVLECQTRCHGLGVFVCYLGVRQNSELMLPPAQLPKSYFYVNSVSPTRSRDDAFPLSRRVDVSLTDSDSAHGQAHKSSRSATLHKHFFISCASRTQRFRKCLSVAVELQMKDEQKEVCCLFDSTSVCADVGTSLYMQCSTVFDHTRTVLSRSCISKSHIGVRRPR
ncbi:hypothetical protein B0H19DRAFT_1261961 [Mycena capillaripes]|nr:hypothetical protein B0H19DRAFT_1261961 [Mycena capillaripes]